MRRVLCIALVIGGAFLVHRGWRTSRDRANVSRVAIRFLESVRDGDVAGARELLGKSIRRRTRSIVPAPHWSALPGARVTIERIEVDRGRSHVRGRVTHSGFSIRPELSLTLEHDGRWRVTEIGHLEVDPRWVAHVQAQRSREDRELSRELELRFGTPP